MGLTQQEILENRNSNWVLNFYNGKKLKGNILMNIPKNIKPDKIEVKGSTIFQIPIDQHDYYLIEEGYIMAFYKRWNSNQMEEALLMKGVHQFLLENVDFYNLIPQVI